MTSPNPTPDTSEDGAAVVLAPEPAEAAPLPTIPISNHDNAGAPAPAPRASRKRRVGAKLHVMFISLEQPDFRRLAVSTLALGFGQWAQQIGLAWLAYSLSGSAVQLGAISAFRAGVGTFTAPIGGWLADRYPRRTVLVYSTGASTLQAAILAALIVTGLIQMWQVYVLAFVGGVIQSFTQPARQAFVYDVSTDETLPNAIAVNSMVQNAARVMGPPLAGAMIGFWGNGAPFAFLACTQVLAMGLTLRISRRTRQTRIRGGDNPLRQMGQGFTAVWQDKRVLGLVVMQMIPSLLVVPYLPFLAVFSKDVLHRGAGGYGQLASMAGWGGLVGLMVLAFLGNAQHKGRLMLACFGVYISMVFIFSQSHSYLLSLAALATTGVFSSVAFALNNTLIQTAARNEARGRIMSVWQLGSGLQPLGTLPMGILVEHYGPAFGVGSFMVVAMTALCLFTIFWGSVRRS